MGRCKRCGKEGWGLRTTREGLCRPCGVSVEAQVTKGMRRIKDALVHIRCTQDPSSVLPLCDEALRQARELLPLERCGLAQIHPLPSSLVEMIEAKRNEVAADLRAAEGARAQRGETAGAAAPLSGDVPTPVPREELPRREDRAQGDESTSSGAWWAWDVNEEEGPDTPEGTGDADSGTNPRPFRGRLHCLVLLDPGGVRATLENISVGGLFLSTPRLRPPGSRVRVILNTPQGPLQAEGVVRWTRPEVSSGPTGMGIEFTHSAPDLKAYLASRFPGLRGEGSGMS